MNQLTSKKNSKKSLSDHRHSFIKPKGRLSDSKKGLFFLLWACECGKEKATDLLPRSDIERIAGEYKKRKGVENVQD